MYLEIVGRLQGVAVMDGGEVGLQLQLRLSGGLDEILGQQRQDFLMDVGRNDRISTLTKDSFYGMISA